MLCPCRKCKDRYPACHSHCDRYKEWRADLDKRKEESKTYYLGKSPKIWYQGGK